MRRSHESGDAAAAVRRSPLGLAVPTSVRLAVPTSVATSPSTSAAMAGREEIGAATVRTVVPNLSAAISSADSSASTSTQCRGRSGSR